MNSRNSTLDYLKVLGIFLVILGHINLENQFLKNWIYSFHVPLFFIISGFLHHQSSSFKEFIVKSFKTLIIPYFCFYLIYWFLEFPIKQCSNFLEFSKEDLVIKPFFGMLLMEGSNTNFSRMIDMPLWFIACLFWVKMIFYFLLKNKNYLLISILISLLTAYFFNRNNIIIFSIDSAFVVVLFYAFGYFFKQLIEKQNFVLSKTKNFLIFSLLIIFSLFLTSINGFVDTNRMNFGNFVFIYFFNALILFLSFYFFFKSFNSISNLVSSISKSTLTILAIHYFFNYLLNKIFFNIPKADFISIPISIFISFFSLLFSYIFHLIIEKYFSVVLGRFNFRKK